MKFLPAEPKLRKSMADIICRYDFSCIKLLYLQLSHSRFLTLSIALTRPLNLGSSLRATATIMQQFSLNNGNEYSAKMWKTSGCGGCCFCCGGQRESITTRW